MHTHMAFSNEDINFDSNSILLTLVNVKIKTKHTIIAPNVSVHQMMHNKEIPKLLLL